MQQPSHKLTALLLRDVSVQTDEMIATSLHVALANVLHGKEEPPLR